MTRSGNRRITRKGAASEKAPARPPGRRAGLRLLAPLLWAAVLFAIWGLILSGKIPLPPAASQAVRRAEPPLPPDPSAAALADRFSGARALDLARRLCGLGSRRPGTAPHARAIALLRETLEAAGWAVTVSTFEDASAPGVTFANLTARLKDRPVAAGKRSAGEILLAARYDSPAAPFHELPAALDSAAGPALLCELAGALARAPRFASRVTLLLADGSSPARQFSAEDGLRGSRLAAASLDRLAPDGLAAVIVIHGVGGEPARLTIPARSSPALARRLEGLVRELGLPLRLERLERPLWDDDLPFLAPERKVLLLHDGDAPQTGTADDTPEKLSARSFEAAGRAVIHLITGL